MILIIWLLAFSYSVQSQGATDADLVRALFFRLDQDAAAANRILQITGKSIHQNDPLMMAYHGVATANTAQQAVSPLTKYNRFREGRRLVEQAIQLRHDLPELRFIRLSMQHKTPSFLNYSSDIESDTRFILDHLEKNPNQPGINKTYWTNVLLYLQGMYSGDQTYLARITALQKVIADKR
ncbi:MAG: hypothetical protein IPM52_02890 [Bacteroidetes bacterium]|nr:hypothetical protein [Bacteroidota bacterium]